jgi:hypothetical protein
MAESSTRITITSHDGANQLISGEAKVKYAEYAKEGTCELQALVDKSC